MEENLSCELKNSELRIPKEKRAFLTYGAAGLCPCSLEEHEDGVVLKFSSEGLNPAQSIMDSSYSEKLRFLINVSELEKLHDDYEFTLSANNIMLDINKRCYILSRDLNCGGASFLEKYMALIGQVLMPKYSYTDYITGGADLYEKKALLSELSKLETVSEIRARLELEYEDIVTATEKTKKLVSKSNVILACVLIPVLVVLLGITAFFGYRAIFIEIPHQDQLITASQAFIASDYLLAQAALADVAIADMTHETRHFLARAYVITEALTDEQKEHMLIGLTRMTNTYMFDFWIHLGRLNFSESREIAQRFGDTELLHFVYLKWLSVVQADITIPGDERTTLIEYLRRNIERIENERDIDISEDVDDVGEEE